MYEGSMQKHYKLAMIRRVKLKISLNSASVPFSRTRNAIFLGYVKLDVKLGNKRFILFSQLLHVFIINILMHMPNNQLRDIFIFGCSVPLILGNFELQYNPSPNIKLEKLQLNLVTRILSSCLLFFDFYSTYVEHPTLLTSQ